MKYANFSSLTVEQAQKMVRRELSTPARLGYLLLLMMTLTAAGLIATLWITEPGPLPMRTHVAFGLLTMINLAWAVLFGWVLTRRKVLYAMHRVIAGWMALSFCALFLLFGLMIAVVRTDATASAFIGLVGAGQLVVAVILLRRARRRQHALLARRDELASMLLQSQKVSSGT
jgi:hypothetical protein